MSKPHIACIDDEREILDLLTILLEPLEVEVFTTTRATELLDHLEDNPVNLVILDLVMPVITGIELLYTIRTRYEKIKCIVLSGAGEKRLIRESILLSETYIEKPFDNHQFVEEIRSTLNL